MRAMAKSIYRAHRDVWSVDDALAFADALIVDRHLEVKGLGIEVMACYRSSFVPRLLPRWKRWLARGYSSNWATTDALCGSLIGQLLVRYPGAARAGRSLGPPSQHVGAPRVCGQPDSLACGTGSALDSAYDVARGCTPTVRT